MRYQKSDEIRALFAAVLGYYDLLVRSLPKDALAGTQVLSPEQLYGVLESPQCGYNVVGKPFEVVLLTRSSLMDDLSVDE